jgi:hypothetical protein
MYEDDKGSQKEQIRRRRIIVNEIFSVKERIKIISRISAIMGKDSEST